MWPFWVIEIDGHELGRYGESIQVFKDILFQESSPYRI